MTDELYPRPMPKQPDPAHLHYPGDVEAPRPRTLWERLQEMEEHDQQMRLEGQDPETLFYEANNELRGPETALEIKEINDLSWKSRIEDGSKEDATESDKKRMTMSPEEFKQDTIDQYFGRVYETYGLTERLQTRFSSVISFLKKAVSNQMELSIEELKEQITEERIFTENLISRLEEGADPFDVIAEHLEEKRKDQVVQSPTETSPVPNAPDKEVIKPDEVISGPVKLTTVPEDPDKKTYAANIGTTPGNNEGVTDNDAQTKDFEIFADPPLINPQTKKIEDPKKTPSEIFEEEFNSIFEELKKAKTENNREAYQKGLRKLISIKNKREEAIDDTLGPNFLKPYTKELTKDFSKRVQSRRKPRPTREERKKKRDAKPGMVDRYKKATQWYEDKRYTHASGEKVLRRAIGVAVSAERSYKTAKQLKRHLFK